MITTYQYSKAHNRTQKVKDGVTSNYSYNNLNQLTGFSEPGRQVYFYYDDNGNRIRRTENGVVDTYAYDYENRLVSLQQGDVPYEYTYDYRTRRVERVEGDTRTKIVFSGGTSVQEYEAIPCEEGGAGGQESGASGGQGCEELKVEYIRGSDYGGGIGGILYTLREGDPSYTHYNNRGDVVAKTDDEQAVTYQATYEAFGTRTHEVGETQDRQKANTKDEDPTGLLNEGFRYRDLEAGSFITRDPLGFKEGPNLYTYVHQNPWSKFDPEGLEESVRELQKDMPYVAPVGHAQSLGMSCVPIAAREMIRAGLGDNGAHDPGPLQFVMSRNEGNPALHIEENGTIASPQNMGKLVNQYGQGKIELQTISYGSAKELLDQIGHIPVSVTTGLSSTSSAFSDPSGYHQVTITRDPADTTGNTFIVTNSGGGEKFIRVKGEDIVAGKIPTNQAAERMLGKNKDKLKTQKRHIFVPQKGKGLAFTVVLTPEERKRRQQRHTPPPRRKR